MHSSRITNFNKLCAHSTYNSMHWILCTLTTSINLLNCLQTLLITYCSELWETLAQQSLNCVYALHVTFCTYLCSKYTHNLFYWTVCTLYTSLIVLNSVITSDSTHSTKLCAKLTHNYCTELSAHFTHHSPQWFVCIPQTFLSLLNSVHPLNVTHSTKLCAPFLHESRY